MNGFPKTSAFKACYFLIKGGKNSVKNYNLSFISSTTVNMAEKASLRFQSRDFSILLVHQYLNQMTLIILTGTQSSAKSMGDES